jgi:putative sterol carrier protein
LTLGLVPFVRLLTGQSDGMKLFMTGKLKVDGDLLFAARVPGFFDPVQA